MGYSLLIQGANPSLGLPGDREIFILKQSSITGSRPVRATLLCGINGIAYTAAFTDK